MNKINKNKKLLKVLKEADKIVDKMESGKIKGYNNIDLLFKDILSKKVKK